LWGAIALCVLVGGGILGAVLTQGDDDNNGVTVPTETPNEISILESPTPTDLPTEVPAALPTESLPTETVANEGESSGEAEPTQTPLPTEVESASGDVDEEEQERPDTAVPVATEIAAVPPDSILLTG